MAENKATTLEQLRALAERGKLDTLNRVDQLLEVSVWIRAFLHGIFLFGFAGGRRRRNLYRVQ